MASSSALALCSLIVTLLLCPFCHVAAQETAFSVAGYLPDYRSYINVNATAPFLTDLMLFSIQPPPASADVLDNGSCCCLGEGHYRIAREARAYKQEKGHGGELRLWVTVGGGGRSDAFMDITTDKEKRSKLINDLLKLCQKEGLQGVDFDWEMPRTNAQLKAYISLLLEASNRLQNAGLLISVALHPRQFLPSHVYNFIDRINLMTYDMADDHVAPYDMAVQAVQDSIKYGCPANKIAMGVPAYARHYQNPGLVKTFAELVDDSAAAVVSKEEWNGYRYDSPASIKQKVEFAKQEGLAGVFLWELGQDKQHIELGPGGILLEAASIAVTAAQDQATAEL